MSLYEITLLIHVILFCYWLGGDIGVFYSSKFVVDPKLSRETRMTATKIMMGCDLIPKICMSLMLTIGGVLTEFHHFEHPLWQMIGIVLLGPVWLAMVLILHFKHNAAFIPALTRIDFYFRWVMIAAILISCAYSASTGRFDAEPWIAAKLLAFALLIFCGLMIRVNLKGFGMSYVKIVQDNYTDSDNQVMISSLNRVKPWVITIWVILVIQAGLGIAKPGAKNDSYALHSSQSTLADNRYL